MVAKSSLRPFFEGSHFFLGWLTLVESPCCRAVLHVFHVFIHLFFHSLQQWQLFPHGHPRWDMVDLP